MSVLPRRRRACVLPLHPAHARAHTPRGTSTFREELEPLEDLASVGDVVLHGPVHGVVLRTDPVLQRVELGKVLCKRAELVPPFSSVQQHQPHKVCHGSKRRGAQHEALTRRCEGACAAIIVSGIVTTVAQRATSAPWQRAQSRRAARILAHGPQSDRSRPLLSCTLEQRSGHVGTWTVSSRSFSTVHTKNKATARPLHPRPLLLSAAVMLVGL